VNLFQVLCLVTPSTNLPIDRFVDDDTDELISCMFVFVQRVPRTSQRVDTERVCSVVHTQSESETLHYMQGRCN